MRIKSTFAVCALTSMIVAGCASVPDLTSTRAVSKKDMHACSQTADKAVNDPNRKNQQTAVVVGSTIGGGLIGLAISAAATSHDDAVVAAKTRDQCLSRKGYKMVPKKSA